MRGRIVKSSSPDGSLNLRQCGISKGGALLDDDNLQSLCNRCHMSGATFIEWMRTLDGPLGTELSMQFRICSGISASPFQLRTATEWKGGPHFGPRRGLSSAAV